MPRQESAEGLKTVERPQASDGVARALRNVFVSPTHLPRDMEDLLHKLTQG